MAERGFAEKTNPKLVGYCYICKRPLKWHKNEFDFSAALGILPIWKCVFGHDNLVNKAECVTCGAKPYESPCIFVDDSRPGYGWGMATRKPAREYATGAKITSETCGYQNPDHVGWPCLKPRGHEEESEFGVGHDHGLVPYDPRKELFRGFKPANSGILVREEPKGYKEV